MKPSFKWGVLMAVGFVIVVALGAKILGGGVKVFVNNSTPHSISNVVLKFAGGSRSFSEVKPKGAANTRINPDRASDLVLEYRDITGSVHSTNIDTYFEHGYRGSIAITIEEGGRVTWKDNVRLPIL